MSLDKLDVAQDSLFKMIKEVSENGVTQEELEAARQGFLKGLIDFTTSNFMIAAGLCAVEIYDLGFDYYDKQLKRAQEIDVAELNRVAKKYLTTDDMARVRVGRIEKA